MKSLLVVLRIIIVGALWGIVFTEGIRVIMLCNWHFDIFWPDHWRQAKELWQAGWVVRAPKEWAFVIILATFFPMLITGWWTLCLVEWEKIIGKILMLPVMVYRHFIKTPLNVMTTNNKYGVVKRKSYKQIRPTGVIGSIRSPISDYGDANKSSAPAYTPPMAASMSAPKPAPAAKKTDVAATIDHALFKFDDDDDDDFDLDIDSFEKTDALTKRQPESKKESETTRAKRSVAVDDDLPDFDDEDFAPRQKENKRPSRRNEEPRRNTDERDAKRTGRVEKSDHKDNSRRAENKAATPASKGPVYDALLQKGYDIIGDIAIGGNMVDFIGVSEDKICLFLVDKESGDWLADEELFNGEEPLWFSESSHRVSPVRKLNVVRNAVKPVLEKEGFEQTLESYVVIQMANIINADDMFEIWKNMEINVTRINRGAPKEIPLLSKTLAEAEGTLAHKEVERLRKVLKNLK